VTGASSVAVVRRGLVVVGLAIALVGGGMVGSLFFLGGVTNTSLYGVAYGIPAGSTENATLRFTPVGTGSLSLAWSSSGPANVSVWAVHACAAGTCPSGPALVDWSSNVSGRWSVSGAIGTYYTVSSTNTGASSVQFSGTFTEQYLSSGSGLTLAQLSLILAGAFVLLAIGGIAIFLGLFLRGGVYSDPAGNVAMPRRSARTELDEPTEELDDEPEQ
jgi:hypothetical protein